MNKELGEPFSSVYNASGASQTLNAGTLRADVWQH